MASSALRPDAQVAKGWCLLGLNHLAEARQAFSAGLAGGDQPVDHADQPGVQHCRQRPFRPVELRGEFVRTGHGPPRHPADGIARCNLMRGVARGKTGGDGKAERENVRVVDRRDGMVFLDGKMFKDEMIVVEGGLRLSQGVAVELVEDPLK